MTADNKILKCHCTVLCHSVGKINLPHFSTIASCNSMYIKNTKWLNLVSHQKSAIHNWTFLYQPVKYENW